MGFHEFLYELRKYLLVLEKEVSTEFDEYFLNVADTGDAQADEVENLYFVNKCPKYSQVESKYTGYICKEDITREVLSLKRVNTTG